MNAGGVPNTCKSSGSRASPFSCRTWPLSKWSGYEGTVKLLTSGGRLSNAWEHTLK